MISMKLDVTNKINADLHGILLWRILLDRQMKHLFRTQAAACRSYNDVISRWIIWTGVKSLLTVHNKQCHDTCVCVNVHGSVVISQLSLKRYNRRPCLNSNIVAILHFYNKSVLVLFELQTWQQQKYKHCSKQAKACNCMLCNIISVFRIEP